jgi:hypothetical protein
MSARPLKKIEQLVIDTAIQSVVDRGYFSFVELIQELGGFTVTPSTIKEHVERHFGIQLIPCRRRWLLRGRQEREFRKVYNPEDEIDAKYFVASGTQAAAYCRPSHATEAMRRYLKKSKIGKAIGTVESAKRTDDAFARDGVTLEPPLPPVSLPSSL